MSKQKECVQSVDGGLFEKVACYNAAFYEAVNVVLLRDGHRATRSVLIWDRWLRGRGRNGRSLRALT